MSSLLPPGQRTFDESGYNSTVFQGKQEQLQKVVEYVKAKGFLPQDLVHNEVSWFYGYFVSFLTKFRNLGIDDLYFQLESVETIASHIMALYGAKILSYIKNQDKLTINLERESDEEAVYIHTSDPGISVIDGPQTEKR